jgi:hypothetical protein
MFMSTCFQKLILMLEFFNQLNVRFTFFFVKSYLFLYFNQLFLHFFLNHLEVLDFVLVLFF